MKKCSINIPEEGFRFQTQEEVLKGDGELVNSYDELYEKIAQLAFVNPNLLLSKRRIIKSGKILMQGRVFCRQCIEIIHHLQR